MKRRFGGLVISTCLVALGLLPGAAPSSAGVGDPTGVLASDNVVLKTSIPNPGVIGARFRGDFMYVTSVSGLRIYNISDPAAPAEVGALGLPHFENEDVDLGGDTLLISNDAAESTGILYVIDISNPTAPSIASTFPMGGDPVTGGPGHTASCIKNCRFAWVTDTGGIRVIDLTDPTAPVSVGTFESPAYGGAATHDVQVDGNGLAWVVGFGGAVAYKIPKDYDGNGLGRIVAQTDERGLSTYFAELGIGDGSNPNDFILHNSHRERNSNVVYITEEDYNRPGCRGAGSFETWRVPTDNKGKPNGQQVTLLDHWETELNVAGAASPAVMCSAHYFDVLGNVAAQGWYEQGIRFLDVSNPKEVRQIGFYSTPNALNWAAYFAPTDPKGEIVYSLDASHGLDVLQLVRPSKGKTSYPYKECTSNCAKVKPKTVTMKIRPEWFAESSIGTASETFGYACRLNLDADVPDGPDLPPIPGFPLP